ncbi:hypothetical protein ACIRBX_12105 [Kitasatospora sp. NPDC096147]|uniref:hypothetical protein n=1 Tax=Kitasatospora sp. NPDC096147 TaxID=3364093 RepID=UPI0037FAAAC6
MVNTAKVVLSDQIREYASQNYTYGWWDFEAVAEENGWPSIDMICDPLGSPVGSSTNPRDYQYDSCAYARGASDAEVIERVLEAVADGEEWAFGPGNFYVFNSAHEGITEAARELESALSGGGLDDERHSQLEWEENHPSENECYASDPDCGCPKALHGCRDQLLAAVESGEADLAADDYWCDFCQCSIDMTEGERAYVRGILYPPKAWWQYSREEFSFQGAAAHKAKQRCIREAEEVWKALGQVPLF